MDGQIAASLPLAQSGETRHEPWDSTPIPGVLVGERLNEQALLEADLDREQEKRDRDENDHLAAAGQAADPRIMPRSPV